MRVISAPADKVMVDGNIKPLMRAEPVNDAGHLAHHFGAYAVARQDQNIFHLSPFSCAARETVRPNARLVVGARLISGNLVALF